MIILRGALCTAGIPEKKKKKYLRALKLQRPVKQVYLITAPKNKANLLEYFRGDQIRQKGNRRRKIPVYGIAGDEESAKELTACMICGTFAATGGFLVTDFLEQRAGSKAGGAY